MADPAPFPRPHFSASFGLFLWARVLFLTSMYPQLQKTLHFFEVPTFSAHRGHAGSAAALLPRGSPHPVAEGALQPTCPLSPGSFIRRPSGDKVSRHVALGRGEASTSGY